jgi:O-antigen/teichoic acid export membrane protein
MSNKINLKSSFVRNVLVLTTGTTIAQAIALAITPILTRIYSPEEFGVFSIYMAIAGLLAIVATGRYEHAIMLQPEDEDAAGIVGLIALIALFISIVILIALLIADEGIAQLLFNDGSQKNLLYFLPASILISGCAQALNYWSNRKSKYKLMASSRVLRTFAAGSSQLSLSITGLNKIGLICGYVIGQTVLVGTLWQKNVPNILKIKSNITLSKIKSLAKRYSDFPKYDLPASIFNQGSQQFLVIFFGIAFGSEVAGYYGLTQRVLSVPIAFIGTAVLDVFKQRASESFVSTGSCRHIYVKVLKILLVLSFIPFTLLFLYGEELFSFVFGREWSLSGSYAQILAFMLLFRFVSSPLSSIYLHRINTHTRSNNFLYILLKNL